MSRITRHIIIPFIMPLLFFAVAATPVEVLGCRNRGWLAIIVSLVSAIWALTTAILALKGRMQGDPKSFWWVVTTLVLVVPVIAMIVLA